MTLILYLFILNLISFVTSCQYDDSDLYPDSLTSDHWSSMDLYYSIQSKNGRWYLTLQDDGNVVGYDSSNHKPFFATNTSCYDLEKHRGIICGRYASFKMQSDGNLVVYTQSTLPVWSTNTNGRGIGPYKVILQNDRNIVLIDSKNEILWSSNTAYYD